MERFLQYSLRHGRPIRLIWLTEEGQLCQGRVTVTALETEHLTALRKRPRGELRLALAQVLSADYIPGDEGQGEEETP